jgi:hypothetical protein
MSKDTDYHPSHTELVQEHMKHMEEEKSRMYDPSLPVTERVSAAIMATVEATATRMSRFCALCL